MTKAEILAYCAKHNGDMNVAARAYAKEHGLPPRAILTGWKVILAPITKNNKAPKAQE